MLVSQKQELEQLKKQQAEMIKREIEVKREALQEESVRSKMKKKFDQAQLKRLEQEVSKSPSPRLSRKNTIIENKVPESNYLQELQDLRSSPLNPIPEEQLAIKLRKVKDSSVKVPVFVPQSTLKKTQKLAPPCIPRAMRNGEVLTVHLLSEKIPTYDPLVKTIAKVDRNELQDMAREMNLPSVKDAIASIQHQFNQKPDVAHREKRPQSLSPQLRKMLKLDDPFVMPKVENFPVTHDTAPPQSKIQDYTFRDVSLDSTARKAGRIWVKDRMKQYSNIVRDSYLPPKSIRKSVEIEMLKDQTLVHKAPVFRRYPLNVI